MRSCILLLVFAASSSVGLCLAAGQSDKTEKKESRRPRIRFGGVLIGAGYVHGSYGWPYRYDASGPWAYPGYLWDPFFYGLWAHPGFYSGFPYYPDFGEVKLATSDKAAAVFIDGGFAGYSGKLKNIWLEPGAYNIEVRSGSREFSKRVYVLSGKSLKLDARPEERP
jgi:hypothetical protein